MSSWPGRPFVLAILLFPLGWLLGGIAIYAVRAHLLGTAPVDPEMARRGRSALLGNTMRQGFAWCASPLERCFVRSAVSPDAMTVTGVAFCCLGAAVMAAGDLTVGGLVVLGSAAFDFLDGRMARARGKASPAGEFLDSTLDRWSDAACFGAAAFLMRENPWNLGAALVAFGACAIVPYARAKAEVLGYALRGGLMQRPERVVVLSTAAIFSAVVDPLWPVGMRQGHPTLAAAVWLLAAATLGTAATRTLGGYRAIRGGPASD